MPHWDQPESCKCVLSVFKVVLDVLNEYMSVEPMHHFCQSGRLKILMTGKVKR